MPGPPPKKEAERRRRNKPADGIATQVINIDELLAGEVEVPMPPTRWVKDPDATDGEGFFDEDDEDDADDPDAVVEPGREGYHEVCAWHPIAEEAYWSLARSGQVIFMEPSDWMTAYTLCETLSRELKPKPMTTTDADGATSIRWVKQPVNGAVLSSFLKGWNSLMATEGERRRLRIELERKRRIDEAAEATSNVIDIVQERAAAFKGA